MLTCHHADGVLHGRAMQRAVLADENAAIDRYDVVFRESFLQLTPGMLVVLRLPVRGHEDSTVDDEEVGVGGRKPMSIVGVVDRRWHGQGE